jgi:acyl-CoA synthetase (AMP-forming)/AMP-acid ligase II
MKPFEPFSADCAAELSAAPLLDAFENFRGSFFDLDRKRRISAADLLRLRTRLLHQLVKFGVGPGDRLVAALPNGPLFAAIWAACLEARASPILVHAETPDPELHRMAELWGAQFVVAELATQNTIRPWQLLSSGEQGALRARRVTTQGAKGYGAPSVPLHPTSGTTGDAKIAVRPGPCAVAEPLHYIETFAIDRSDLILCAIPMTHAYAYGICFLVALLTSCELHFMRRFNPGLALGSLNEMSVSVFPAVPIMIDSLLDSDVTGLRGRPRIVLSAGAPLTQRTFEAFHKRYGLAIRSLYGTTETGGISVSSPEAEFDGTVGAPMRGVEVRLQASEAGLDAKILQVRSSSLMSGYLDENGIDRSPLAAGWFETSDLARLDAHGRIHLLGRLSEVINAFGYKVVPREVEDVISLLPGVIEVKVYPRQWRSQEVVEAAVVCRGSLGEEQILRHCEKHLVSYKCPTAIRFVDALPRTASGKVAVDRLISSSTAFYGSAE